MSRCSLRPRRPRGRVVGRHFPSTDAPCTVLHRKNALDTHKSFDALSALLKGGVKCSVLTGDVSLVVGR